MLVMAAKEKVVAAFFPRPQEQVPVPAAQFKHVEFQPRPRAKTDVEELAVGVPADVQHAELEAAQSYRDGRKDPAALERLAVEALSGRPELELDYVALFDEATLERPAEAGPGNVLAGAVKLGGIRLIDNVILGAEVL